MKWLIFKLILEPLIKRNYRERVRLSLADGIIYTPENPSPYDKWYWADYLAIKWGYAVNDRDLRFYQSGTTEPKTTYSNNESA